MARTLHSDGMLSGLHHVGHLTEDYDETIDFYRDVLGGEIGETATVDDAVKVAFVEFPDLRIEVVAREERGTYLDDLMDELLDVSPYHLAVVVEDIEEAMLTCEEAGYTMYDTDPVEGLGPYVRAFVEPTAVPGLPIELVELEGE